LVHYDCYVAYVEVGFAVVFMSLFHLVHSANRGIAPHAVTVNCGLYHSCATLSNTNTGCWGDNTSGQLGDGTTSGKLVPVKAKFGASVVSKLELGPAALHTCGVLANERMKCTGDNYYGQLGDGTTTSKSTYVLMKVDAINALTGVVDGACGFQHTCVIVGVDKKVKCVGDNTYGQPGDGTTTDRSVASLFVVRTVNNAQLTNVIDICAGAYHSCVVIDGGVW
jgi:alpha-tubulin suppressor-like RCC1 family protein